MDRNISALESYNIITVALRKESVDRNLVSCVDRTIDIIVALRKESVDRNGWGCFRLRGLCASLSARRAWIEICAG